MRFVKGLASPETGQAFARARELWEQLGSPSQFLQVPFGQSHYHAFRGELDLAHRLDEDLLRRSRQRNDPGGLILGHLSSGRNLAYGAKFAVSRWHLEKVLELYDPDVHRALLDQAGYHCHVSSLAFLGIVLFILGFPDQALERARAAMAEARRLAHPPSLATSLAVSTTVFSLCGDDASLRQYADELVTVATDQAFPHWSAIGRIFRGWVTVKNGDLKEGISLLGSGCAAMRAAGVELWMTHYVGLLAEACEIAGHVEEAIVQLDDALRVVERTGERWFVADLNRHKGRLLLRQGHMYAAEELYCKSLSIAQEQEAKLWELRAAIGLAQLRRDQDRRAEARDILKAVHGGFTEGFDTPDLKDARRLLDELA